MKISVRLFAAAKQKAGRDSIDVELPEGATIGQLREALSGQMPDGATLIARAMFALGADYATDDTQIPADADVALIPPVSGG